MPNPWIGLIVLVFVTATSLLLFWPEWGFFWRWQQARQMTVRVLSEDALKHIYKCEAEGRRPTVQSVAGVLHITVDSATDLLSRMESRQLLKRTGSEFLLTPEGRDYALHIIRTHRLWERYLAEKTGFAETEWHGQAERFEHTLSPAEANDLSAQLGYPTHDPHGDPIPTAAGEVIPPQGQPLTAMSIEQPGRIVHLEDEPEAVYAQLVAEGLYPGMEVRLIEFSPQRVRFWANDDEHVLAPIVASNISVMPLPRREASEAMSGEPLSNLKPGERGKILSLSRACRNIERRRLMDLGIVPGTAITAEMSSPNGDPTAYRIRGALIALRQEQAGLIRITRREETAR